MTITASPLRTGGAAAEAMQPSISGVCARPSAEILIASALVLVGGMLRFAALESFPSGIHVDETGWGLFALGLLRGNGPHPFGSAFLGEPAALPYFQAPFLALFGRSMTALRTVAAIAGTLTLIPMYLLVRSLFGRRSAFLATAFLAACAAHLHFSRVSMNIAEVPLFASLSLLFIWHGHRTGRAAWWLLGGMAATGGIYFNSGGLILSMIVALFMLHALVLHPQSWRRWMAGAGLLALGGAMVLLPMALYLGKRGYKFYEHGESSVIFRSWDRLAAQYGSPDPLPILWGQLKLNFLPFVNMADVSSFYTFTGAPLLNGLTALPFAIGLALVTLRLRDTRCALVFFWFWTTVIIAGVLTRDPPQFQRLVPALPAAVICAALALDGLAEAAVALLGRAGRPALTAAVAVVPLAAGVYDGSAYFGRYAEAYPYAEATAQANFIAGLGSNYQVFVVAAPTFDANHPNIRFLAPEADARELTNPTAQLPAPPLQKPLAVVVYQGRQDMLALLQSLYPGGELRPIEHPPGRYLNTAYLVPVESASRSWPDGQGLARELRPEQAGAPAVPHLDRAIAFRDLAALSPAPGQPFRANWRGELLAPRPGGYELELLTDGAAVLRLDGRDVLQDAAQPGLARPLKGTITLEPGPHPIEIDYRWARGPGYLELRWRLPGREPSLVPPEALRAR